VLVRMECLVRVCLRVLTRHKAPKPLMIILPPSILDFRFSIFELRLAIEVSPIENRKSAIENPLILQPDLLPALVLAFASITILGW